MVNRIGTVYPHGLNKGFSSRFCICSWVRHETPEESPETYRLKCWEYNNKDGGACGVMVIDTSSNPGRDWLHFT